MRGTTAAPEDRTMTVRVPLTIKRRGGRKLVIAPDGATLAPAQGERYFDNATVKAIARAFRWQEMLEDGTCSTIAEIAAAEKINETYIGRVLRLTLLAPQIIEHILAAQEPPSNQMIRNSRLSWQEQLKIVGLRI